MQRPASPLAHMAPADMPEDLRQLHAASTEVVGEARGQLPRPGGRAAVTVATRIVRRCVSKIDVG